MPCISEVQVISFRGWSSHEKNDEAFVTSLKPLLRERGREKKRERERDPVEKRYESKKSGWDPNVNPVDSQRKRTFLNIRRRKMHSVQAHTYHTAVCVYNTRVCIHVYIKQRFRKGTACVAV